MHVPVVVSRLSRNKRGRNREARRITAHRMSAIVIGQLKRVGQKSKSYENDQVRSVQRVVIQFVAN